MSHYPPPPANLDKHRAIADLRERLILSVGKYDAAWLIWETSRRAGPDATLEEWARTATEIIEGCIAASIEMLE